MNVTFTIFPAPAGAPGEPAGGLAAGPGTGVKLLSGQSLGVTNPFALLLSGQLSNGCQATAGQALPVVAASGKLPPGLAQLLPQDGKALPGTAIAVDMPADGDTGAAPAPAGPLALNLAAELRPPQAGAGNEGGWTLNVLKLVQANADADVEPQLPNQQQRSGEDSSLLRMLQTGVLRTELDRGAAPLPGQAMPAAAQGGVPDAAAANAVSPLSAEQSTRGADLQPKAVASPQAALQQPLGKQGWDQELGSRLVWMNKQDVHSAQLRLNPAHLGPLEVRLSLQQDQTAHVAFLSNHASVRDAVEAAIPRLREMLAESGVNLADVDVSSQSHGQAREQSPSSDNWMAKVSADMDATTAEEVAREVSVGLVDYFA